MSQHVQLIQTLLIFLLFLGGAFAAVVHGRRLGVRPIGRYPTDSHKESNDENIEEELDDETPAERRHRLVSNGLRLALFVGLIFASVYYWPTLSSAFFETNSVVSSAPADTLSETSDTVTEDDPSKSDDNAEPSERIDESTDSWQIHTDETYGYRLRYPPEWGQRETETVQIEHQEKIIQAFELTPVNDKRADIYLRVHLEENMRGLAANSFASIHPSRGKDRTPYTLHGVRAIKYTSTLLATKQTRIVTFAATEDQGYMLVIELLAPFGIDTFDATYNRAERIISTIESQYRVTEAASGSPSSEQIETPAS